MKIGKKTFKKIDPSVSNLKTQFSNMNPRERNTWRTKYNREKSSLNKALEKLDPIIVYKNEHGKMITAPRGKVVKNLERVNAILEILNPKRK